MGFISKLWKALWAPSMKPLGLLLGGGLFVGAFGILFFNFVMMEGTSTLEFCATSCHEMKLPYEEYKKSVHYSNPSGVRATCADCHVPHMHSLGTWVDKVMAKMHAALEIYHWVLGTYDTEEKYEAGRWEMANSVWAKMRKNDSAECRYCHDFEAMKLEEQDRSARKKHVRAMKEGKTCIDCHQGIAHKEPEEPEEPEAKEED